jgi:hypothetical protein
LNFAPALQMNFEPVAFAGWTRIPNAWRNGTWPK